MRTTFAVGRLTPRSAEIVLLNQGRGNEDRNGEHSRTPFPGPWKLEALVARLRTRHSGDRRCRKPDGEAAARIH